MGCLGQVIRACGVHASQCFGTGQVVKSAQCLGPRKLLICWHFELSMSGSFKGKD